MGRLRSLGQEKREAIVSHPLAVVSRRVKTGARRVQRLLGKGFFFSSSTYESSSPPSDLVPVDVVFPLGEEAISFIKTSSGRAPP